MPYLSILWCFLNSFRCAIAICIKSHIIHFWQLRAQQSQWPDWYCTNQQYRSSPGARGFSRRRKQRRSWPQDTMNLSQWCHHQWMCLCWSSKVVRRNDQKCFSHSTDTDPSVLYVVSRLNESLDLNLPITSDIAYSNSKRRKDENEELTPGGTKQLSLCPQ